MYLSEQDYYKKYRTKDKLCIVIGSITMLFTVVMGIMAIQTFITEYTPSKSQFIVMVLWLIGMPCISLTIVSIGREEIIMEYVKGDYIIPNRLFYTFIIVIWWIWTIFVSCFGIVFSLTDLEDGKGVAIFFWISTAVCNAILLYLICSRRYKMKIIRRKEIIKVSILNKVRIKVRKDAFPDSIYEFDNSVVEIINDDEIING